MGVVAAEDACAITMVDYNGDFGKWWQNTTQMGAVVSSPLAYLLLCKLGQNQVLKCGPKALPPPPSVLLPPFLMRPRFLFYLWLRCHGRQGTLQTQRHGTCKVWI